ncbi:MAG: site-specific integrase [Verrucomicrobiae bacterium]|nr:site-specific integrase [Verrucomicrobiae bacterium]
MAALEKELEGVGPRRTLQQTILSPEQLADAETASQSIGERGLSQIVSHYLNLESRARAKGVTLDRALAFFEAHHRPEIQEVSIYNAREEFLHTRIGLAPKTASFYKSSTKHLLLPDPNRLLHTITVGDLEDVLRRFPSVNSKRTMKTALGVFFNWAVRHHYCLENPCERLDKIPQPVSPVAILAMDEIKRLLKAAIDYRDGEMAPLIAIALFAGLRPSEIAALKPEDVSEERIRITGGKMARRKVKRSVPVPPILKKWIRAYPFTAVPKQDALAYRMRVLRDATKAERWVQDVLRHTSITYQAERDRNEGVTAFNNGTSKAMMDRHYRDVIDDPDQVKKFWALEPKSLSEVEVVLPGHSEIDWPTTAQLKELVWQKPLVHAAAEIGVSDVALRKHCVKLGIELPPRGHWLRN